MFKSHVVEQPLNRGALCIGAVRSEIPIAVGMRLRVAHDDLAKRALPCLGGATPLPDKAGDQQLFEIGGSHTHRLAVVSGQSSRPSPAARKSREYGLSHVHITLILTQGQSAFVTYVTAGFPTPEETPDILLAMEAGGAGIYHHFRQIGLHILI